MPITQSQIIAAQKIQHSAAHDPSQQIRIIAGPGTGKSYAIEERVYWLLSQNIAPDDIAVISFTRASSLDLRTRVHSYCMKQGQLASTRVRVGTLHSLALRTLRAAGLLTSYPADPLVLDDWEVENIFDAEFNISQRIGGSRCAEIRREHEAFWSTGQWGPANYIPPTPPISSIERIQFQNFHSPRTQSYSCVLPGEIVRQCVEHMKAGTLDPVELLHLKHLIVDEYQDLNPMDLEFIDFIAGKGVVLFVAGDDDQSIYSFRYASPAGIQKFATKYPRSGRHTLSECFRCTPNVLDTGHRVISANPGPHRIPKDLTSLYITSSPKVLGVTHLWRFRSGLAEAQIIAESCDELIKAGINPREILILLGNRRVLLAQLINEFQKHRVPVETPRTESFLDTETGRFVLSILRIVSEKNDYVAHRVLLGLLPQVGTGTCNAICQMVIYNNLNYREIFYKQLPQGIFKGRALTATNRARGICTQLLTWQATDTISLRLNEISGMINNLLGPQEANNWQDFASTLPKDTSLKEIRDILWADTDEQQAAILQAVYERLGLPIPTAGFLPPRVRIMTMHGAKGLSGCVVFIPGLEEEILPGHWRQPYPGLVLEAARLLYVSVTRAKSACIISYAGTRMINGQFNNQTPSRFCSQLGGTFAYKNNCLTTTEVQQIARDCSNL